MKHYLINVLGLTLFAFAAAAAGKLIAFLFMKAHLPAWSPVIVAILVCAAVLTYISRKESK